MVSEGGTGRGGTGTTQAQFARGAFAALGEVERSALVLAYAKGMRAGEIAAVLGVEPAVIRGALREALLSLSSLKRALSEG